MSAATVAEVNLKRCGPFLHMDPARVLLRRFYPSSHDITKRIVKQITEDMSAEQRKEQLSIIMDEFGNRHGQVLERYVQRFREVRANVGEEWSFDRDTRALIGAHFMQEYSIESAALFNPSIVQHPDQSGLTEGATRFIVSLRATGEGHISSVAFRTGIINKHNRVSLEPQTQTLIEAVPITGDSIDKAQLLQEMKESHGVTRGWEEHHNRFVHEILDDVPEQFNVDDLRRVCTRLLKNATEFAAAKETVCKALLLLAEANYTVKFDPNSAISQRVLFPSAPSQSNGIEDARFVEVHDDDGKRRYYATFSAYNGRSVLPQFMVTEDFVTFRFRTLVGEVSNKGMALFPRKVSGRYWMLSRQDDINVMLMSSETMYKWEDPQPVIRPEQPWELFKMGNCGSPLETPKGWLVLTHGVGPMRRYAIGAVMLDIEDPSKVIGRLKDPLIKPNETEREGYVPNVVYTCGAMIHNGTELIIPYAMSDSVSSFATVSLESLYRTMGL